MCTYIYLYCILCIFIQSNILAETCQPYIDEASSWEVIRGGGGGERSIEHSFTRLQFTTSRWKRSSGPVLQDAFTHSSLQLIFRNIKSRHFLTGSSRFDSIWGLRVAENLPCGRFRSVAGSRKAKSVGGGDFTKGYFTPSMKESQFNASHSFTPSAAFLWPRSISLMLPYCDKEGWGEENLPYVHKGGGLQRSENCSWCM